MKSILCTKLFLTVFFFTQLYSCKKEIAITPSETPPSNITNSELSTILPSSITLTTANTGGIITNLQNDNIIEKGVCLSISTFPTINDIKIVGVPDTARNFSCAVTNLLRNTKYYVRAYIKTSTGSLIYGNEVSFRTFSKQLLNKIEDSLSSAVYDTLQYDNELKLTRYRVTNAGFGMYSGYVDTFIYNGLT